MYRSKQQNSKTHLNRLLLHKIFVRIQIFHAHSYLRDLIPLLRMHLCTLVRLVICLFHIRLLARL